MSKKILFISHDASATGAPILLLNFMQWLKENTEIPFQILLKKGGQLEKEFQEIAPVWFYSPPTSPKNGLIDKSLKRLKLKSDKKDLKAYQQSLFKKLAKENIGLIYGNTMTVGDVLEYLSPLNCPVICHIHELEYSIRYAFGVKQFNKVKRYTKQFIGASEAVKSNLVQNHNIPAETIETIYEFLPSYSHKKNSINIEKETIFKELQIPTNAKVVCASGSIIWRKSPDLFLLLARSVISKYTEYPVHFIWIGGPTKGSYFDQLWYDAEQLGIKEHIHFIGFQPNPLDYFKACDIFTLVSREDPYPIVCLEAASVGKPIVCFDGAGGEKEFVEDDSGFVVPYLDVEMMATKIVKLLQCPELSEQFGQQARQKVQQRHNLDVTGAKLLKVINRLI